LFSQGDAWAVQMLCFCWVKAMELEGKSNEIVS